MMILLLLLLLDILLQRQAAEIGSSLDRQKHTAAINPPDAETSTLKRHHPPPI